MYQETVLLIDDDDSLRRVTEYTLREAGYRVISVASGEEGLSKFAAERPALVITDIQMPGISGYDVIKRIKEESPETLVIAITAFGTIEKAVEAMKVGAHDYICKPFSRDELIAVLDRARAFLGLKEENTRLKERLSEKVSTSIIGTSDSMQDVLEMVKRVADSESTALILGESGTGKEVVAQAIHQGSNRRNGPFIPVNCAAIPRELLESELFGHVKGAFTGAIKNRKGKFELADGGTLFLDEVAELPIELQPKLLRVLQEREIEPVGGGHRKVDVRVIAATNKDVETGMKDGSFREDLYYRLAVVPLDLPPLRKRREDIPLLMEHFLAKYGNSREITLTDEAMERLMEYDWPGNVRELENAVERMMVLCRSNIIDELDLPPKIGLKNSNALGGVLNLPAEGYSLEDLEKGAVMEALQRNGGNKTRAATFLQIPRHVLVYRMEKYDIRV